MSLSPTRISGCKQALVGLEVSEIQAAVVAHPAGIDVVVFARRLAIDHVFARADDGVAAGRATRAKAFRLLQKPDAHLEAEIRGGQRADRTNIDRVERIIVLQPLSGMRGQNGVAAAIDETQHVVVRDFLAKPDAARAENATLVIERDARTELDVLRFLYLVLEETRFRVAVFDAEFLEAAFAGLIADRDSRADD